MTNTPDERHALLRVMHESASPAPWAAVSTDDQVALVSNGRVIARLGDVQDDQPVHDAMLVTTLRNNITWLLDELAKRDAAIEAARAVAAEAYRRADANRRRAQQTDDEYAHGLATGQSKVAAALRRTLREAMGETL